MKKILFFFIFIVTGLLLITVANTLMFASKQIKHSTITASKYSTIEDNASKYLSAAIQFKTISSKKSLSEYKTEFSAFNHFLAQSFPLTHKTLTKQSIGQHSLLYIWKGSQPTLKPVLYITHSDVVPVESNNIKNWLHPPFSGALADNYIWGRGTMDNKLNVISQLIAIEYLIKNGFEPRRTILFAISADEETGGNDGAKNIAAYLKKKNLQPEFILDEGGVISKNIIPAISQPVALIGIAEKGYLTLILQVNQPGGHASMPPDQTAIGILGSALHKLENTPFAGIITSPIKHMFRFLGPEMGVFNKFIFANLWLFDGLVKQKMASSASTNASIRTTLAFTRFNAGIMENVLPATASATVNIRLLPEQTIEATINAIRKTINDPRIRISKKTLFNEASPVANINTVFFHTLHKTIRQLYPDTLVAPFLTVTATDSRHFIAPENNVYRFSPLPVNKEDLKRIHGLNERIAIEDFNKVVAFYQLLISGFDASGETDTEVIR